MHKVSWHRKHDGKEWEDDFKVDNTWVKHGSSTTEAVSSADSGSNDFMEGFTKIDVDDTQLRLQANEVEYIEGGFVLLWIGVFKEPQLVSNAKAKYQGQKFLISCDKNTVSEFKSFFGGIDGSVFNEITEPYKPIAIPEGSNFAVAKQKFCK